MFCHFTILESDCQVNSKITAHLVLTLLSHLARSELNSQSELKVSGTLTNEHAPGEALGVEVLVERRDALVED